MTWTTQNRHRHLAANVCSDLSVNDLIYSNSLLFFKQYPQCNKKHITRKCNHVFYGFNSCSDKLYFVLILAIPMSLGNSWEQAIGENESIFLLEL